MAKVALVTGAGRGIGRGIALALAEAGWAVVINYRGNAATANETAELAREAGGEALVVQADIGAAADRARLVEAALERFGRIDLLVNNAGMGPRTRLDILETTEASYDEVMNVNLKGPFFLSQLVAHTMLERLEPGVDRADAPKIINIGSISAYTSSPTRGEYCISKAGVTMMTLLFADRLAESGINVYEVRPGIVETDMTSGVKGKYDKLIGDGLTPIRRWGQPEDVGRAVVAVAEGRFPFSTGEVLNVDGGFHMHRL
ncbi:MAG: 3-ketoacyl-ACP reductase [Caldilineaceae bacterium]|nr:3-ketoacyl-ACP reductase [Caldilineaceae bacterium]